MIKNLGCGREKKQEKNEKQHDMVRAQNFHELSRTSHTHTLRPSGMRLGSGADLCDNKKNWVICTHMSHGLFPARRVTHDVVRAAQPPVLKTSNNLSTFPSHTHTLSSCSSISLSFPAHTHTRLRTCCRTNAGRSPGSSLRGTSGSRAFAPQALNCGLPIALDKNRAHLSFGKIEHTRYVVKLICSCLSFVRSFCPPLSDPHPKCHRRVQRDRERGQSKAAQPKQGRHQASR